MIDDEIDNTQQVLSPTDPTIEDKMLARKLGQIIGFHFDP